MYKAVNNWWIYLLMGLFLIALSIGVLSTPEEGFLQLTYFFCTYLFINGGSNIVFALSSRDILEDWGWHFAYGVLELIIGILLLTYPQINMLSLSFILGFWLLFNAVFLTGTAFELRKYGYSYGVVHWSFMLYFSTVLAVLALFVMIEPGIGIMTMVGWVSLSLLILGMANILLAYKLRYIRRYALHQQELTRSFFRERIDNLKKDIKKYKHRDELNYRLDVFISELEDRVME